MPFFSTLRKNTNFDVSAAMLQLTDYYTNFLRSYPEGADIVETDTPTIIACAKWCSLNNEHKALVNVAFGSYDILFSLGLFNERIETALLATESAIKSEELSLAAHFITVSASTYTIIGNYSMAESELERGLRYAEESKDGLRIAYMKRCISLNYYRQGYVNEACKPLFGLTKKLKKLIQDEHNLDRLNELRHAYIDILALIGAIEFFNKEYSSALTTFGDMLSACNEAEWKRAISYPLRDLGEIAMVYENNFPKAYKHLTDALELAKDYRDYRQIGKIELSLVKYMLYKNKLAKANQHFASAYDLFMKMGLDNELEELEALYNGKSSNPIAKKMHRLSFPFKKLQGYYGTKTIGGE